MNVAAETVRLKRWLVETALPLWWERGVDRSGWGYQESLHLDASPSNENRRCRVQARQVYSFLLGATLGGAGDQQQAIEIGFSALRLHYRRPDGLYRTVVSPAGDIIDDTPKLYDHAFILLALASARAFWPGAKK